MNKLATILLFVNFVTVLFPQPGYIHPDEFFQSTEIVAGDVLGVYHTRAWEFNASSPIRNMVFPYLLVAPSLHLLRWMNSTNFAGLKISAVKIVMATRLPISFLSLFGFLATDRLSRHFKADSYLSQVLWCSSYVTWTYFTRTFSNSVEAFLLALVLLITLSNLSDVCVVKEPCGERSGKRKGGEKEEDEEENEVDGKKEKRQSSDKKPGMNLNKGRKHKINGKGGDDFGACKSVGRTACVLGFVLMAGFFNRPTFLLLAFIPMIHWFIKVCTASKSFITSALVVILWGSVGLFTGLVLFVVGDTIYYNPNCVKIMSDCVEKIVESQCSAQSFMECFDLIRSSLVITPWNFMKYNMNSENLAEHGLHSRHTHLLVNLPLLLGPLFFPFMAACILSLTQQLFRGKKMENAKNSLWLVLMVFVPVVGLSLFPHQEPRFLIPLLPMLIVLGVKLIAYMASGKKLFFILWVVFNIVLNLIYGYVHQAAMIPALSIYQQKLSSPKTVTKLMAAGTNHAFFYKTYQPPLHLLLLDPHQTHFKVHDLAGSPVHQLVSKVKAIEKQRWIRKGKNQVFIFLPSTSSHRVTDLLVDDLKEYGVKLSTTSICPHLSTESLPRFRQFWSKKISFEDFIMDFCLNVVVIT